MGIGTSLGAFYDDEFHYQQSQHDPKKYDTNDNNVITPNQQSTNKELENTELNPSTGMGLEVNQSSDIGMTPKINNLDGIRNEELRTKEKLQNSHDEFDKQMELMRNNTRKFYEDNTPEMLGPELEEIYRKNYGPRRPKDESTPMSSLGADVSRVAYKTASPLVTITDKDIDNAISVGMAAGPGTMAGVKAILPNESYAALGKAMSKEGFKAAPDHILKETGWFKGSDGKWRTEVSDDGMKLVDKDWKFGDKGKVSDFIDHPELFKAYPQLKDINFEVAPKDYKYIASYNDASKTLMVNPAAVKAGDEGLLDVVSHELQHSVQSIEGFSPGSNPNVALGKALLATAKIKDKDEAQSIFSALMNQANAFANYFYQRAPGEVEANLTAARRKLTTEERKKWSPEMTQELLNGSPNSMSGGTYHPEFNYPK